MSDTLTFAELEAQHVELLPARTVLSLMFSAGGGRGSDTSHGGSGGTAVAVNAANLNFGGNQNNVALASADGGHSGIHHGYYHHHAPTNTSAGGNGGIAIAVNAGNINFGGNQNNVAVASANGGSSHIR